MPPAGPPSASKPAPGPSLDALLDDDNLLLEHVGCRAPRPHDDPAAAAEGRRAPGDPDAGDRGPAVPVPRRGRDPVRARDGLRRSGRGPRHGLNTYKSHLLRGTRILRLALAGEREEADEAAAAVVARAGAEAGRLRAQRPGARRDRAEQAEHGAVRGRGRTGAGGRAPRGEFGHGLIPGILRGPDAATFSSPRALYRGVSPLGRPQSDHAARRLIDAYLLDELDEANARRLAEHVRDCPSCAAELGGTTRLIELLRTLPEPQPSADLDARIISAALADRRLRIERRPWYSGLPRQVFRGAMRTTGTLVATVVAVALIGGAFVFAASSFILPLPPSSPEYGACYSPARGDADVRADRASSQRRAHGGAHLGDLVDAGASCGLADESANRSPDAGAHRNRAPTAPPLPTEVPTASPEPAETPALAVASPEPTITPEPSATATPEPSATATPEPTPEPDGTADGHAGADARTHGHPEPTATASPTPSATASPSPTPSPTASPTEDPSASPDPSTTPKPRRTPPPSAAPPAAGGSPSATPETVASPSP